MSKELHETNKELLKSVLTEIPKVLNQSNITFTQQGKYEFVVCDCSRSQLESLLSEIPNFNEFCEIFTEKNRNYIRSLYY